MEHPNFQTPTDRKPPEPIDIKLDLGDYVGDLTSYANFGISTLTGAWLHMHEIVINRVYFLHQVTFYCLAHLHTSHLLTDFHVLWLKRRVVVSSTSFLGCEQNTFIYFPYFLQQKSEIPYSHNLK